MYHVASLATRWQDLLLQPILVDFYYSLLKLLNYVCKLGYYQMKLNLLIDWTLSFFQTFHAKQYEFIICNIVAINMENIIFFPFCSCMIICQEFCFISFCFFLYFFKIAN